MGLIKIFTGLKRFLTQGNGKTLGMTILSYKLKNEGYKLLTNYECKFNDEFFEPSDLNNILENYNNTVVAFDEIHMFISAYDGIDEEKEDLRKLLRQLRKKNIIVMGTTQIPNEIPTIIRRSDMDLFYVIKIHKDNTLCNKPNNSECEYNEHQYIIKRRGGKELRVTPHLNKNGKKLTNWFYNAYNTDEIVILDGDD